MLIIQEVVLNSYFTTKVQSLITRYHPSEAFFITENNKRKFLKITKPCVTTIFFTP